MKNKYNCISVVNITKAIYMAFFVVLPSLMFAQQAPSIQTGVTFEWEEVTQPNQTSPATIKSITINGQVYSTFVVPSDYELTRLGPDGHGPNKILKNGVTIRNGSNTNANGNAYAYGNGGNTGVGNGNNNNNNNNAGDGSPFWNSDALEAFQDKNLNHYFTANPNGRNICLDFDAVETTDAQKQSIFYDPAIPSNEGGILAVTERNVNNCYHVAMYGTPAGGGPEQLLGQTFVRPNGGALSGPQFGPPNPGTDYWRTNRVVENNGTIGIALFYLSDIVPVGSRISRIEFNASTRDHGDGKFFLLQKYAIDKMQTNCINEKYFGDLMLTNNVPENSTYEVISGPTPAGQYFELNQDGTYSYIPQDNFTGDVTFDYRVCLPAPNESVCDEATVTMTFVNLPSDPEIDISCDSTSDNYIIEVTSPLGPEFEYQLNNGTFQSSPIFSRPEGIYNLSVRSVYSECINEFSGNPITIEDLELTATITDALCKLEDSGGIDLTVSGGTGPYTYLWSNSSTSPNLTGVFAGMYSVTVTDANGCTVKEEFEVDQPDEELSVHLEWVKNVDCHGNDSGDFKVAGSGGTPPYLYSIDGGVTTQSSGFFPPPFTAGTYTVTIIDNNQCTSTVDVEITQPNPLIITVDSITNVSCYGENTGDVFINVEGGTQHYTYAWSDGSTSQNLTNVNAGTYTISVTDGNGCETSKEITITQPSHPLSADFIYNKSVKCHGESTGSIKYQGEGGTAPYRYSLDGGTTTQSERFFTDLVAGDYTFTILDANDCTVSVNFTISQPEPIVVLIDKIDATSIEGCTNGSATANPSGGVGPYTFEWSASAGGQTTAIANNLPIGNHTVTVNDANGCEATQSVQINCTNDCDTSLITGATTNVLCYGDASGSTSVSASSLINPTATFTFTWSNGQTDAGVTSSSISNVIAGDYTVSVTLDGSVCDPVLKTITISEPDSVVSALITAQTNIVCQDQGSITIESTGGTAPYSYSIDNGSNFETIGTFTGLFAGNYTIIVLDANGCSTSISTEILANCTDAIDDINNTFVDLAVSGNLLTNDEDFEG
ncbi:Ig-like domain-containing protein, partial [Winogradskyella flava]